MDDLCEDTWDHVSSITAVVAHTLNNYNACLAVAQAASAILLELQEDSVGDYSVNPLIAKISRFDNLVQGHVSLFKMNTGFFPSEFEAVCQQVCPVLSFRSRHTNEMRGAAGRPTKLTLQERVLASIMYLRRCNGVRAEAASWNYSRTSLRDDAFFVFGVINEVMSSEVSWPGPQVRSLTRNRIPLFRGCIGFVDGTLCKIRRPRHQNHRAYFNGRKKMYCFNCAVAIDHDGLFIFIAPGYAGSFHDVTVLRDTELARNWQNFFTIDHSSPHPLEYPARRSWVLGHGPFHLEED